MKITRGPNQLAQQANDKGGPRHIKHKQNTNDTRQNEKTDKVRDQINNLSRSRVPEWDRTDEKGLGMVVCPHERLLQLTTIHAVPRYTAPHSW